MISPEVLRKYPFFGLLTQPQLEKVAMLAEKIPINMGDNVFETDTPANNLFFLLSGSVELCTESYDKFYEPDLRRGYRVGEVNPSEVFGLQAIVSPYIYTSSAQATSDCDVLKIDAIKLRTLMDNDTSLALALMTQATQALSERLNYTRIQLAAARP